MGESMIDQNRIRTARLELRPYRDADPVLLTAIMKDPLIYRNVGLIRANQSIDETRRVQLARAQSNDLGKSAGFCAYLEGELVGVVGGGEAAPSNLIDFGYWIAPANWGNGFATEAARAVLCWFLRFLARRAFTAAYFADNPASGRVLEKLGFMKTGESRHHCLGRGEDLDGIDMYWPTTDDVLPRYLERCND